MSVRSNSLFISLLAHALLLPLLAAPLRHLGGGTPVAATALQITVVRGEAEPVNPSASVSASSGSTTEPAPATSAPGVTPKMNKLDSTQAKARTRPPVKTRRTTRQTKANGATKPPVGVRPATQSLSKTQTVPSPPVASVQVMKKPDMAGSERIEAEQAYRVLVLQLLEKNKHYPLRARRKGQQGEVLIDFVITRDGRQAQASVKRPSGNPVLDRAALATLERIQRFPAFPSTVQRRQWRFQAPIRFTLD